MRSRRESFRLIPIVIAVTVALGCDFVVAASVGEMQGTALIGRPLNLTALMSVGEGESEDALCLAAEVLYGDTKIHESRVKLTPTRSESGVVLVRMRVDQPVDEPVVTVTLRAGCKSVSARRSVVLAELIPQGDSLGQSGNLAAAPKARSLPATSQQGEEGLRTRIAGSSVSEAIAGKKRLIQRDDVRASSAVQSQRAAVKVAVADRVATLVAKPRLKLDLADLTLSVEPVLRLSTDVPILADTSDETRQQARAFWAAFNKSTDDLLKDAVNAQGQRDQVAAMTAALKQAKATEDALRIDVLEAQAERFSNPLVWVLGGIAVLASVIAVGLGLGTRRSAASGRAWWRAGIGHAGDGSGDVVLNDSGFVSEYGVLDGGAGSGIQRFRAEKAATSSLAVDRATEAETSPPLDLPSFFASSYMPNARQVKTEELFDIQQQADFFVSLGEHQQAIDLLETHIRENPEGSPLAYLDLLQIHHVLKRADDFSVIRNRFQAQFAVKIPDFEDFAESADGLDAFPAAISRISALWPDAKVIEVLEEAVFREPNSAFDDKNFTLEAYRDLLLLYGIAKQICVPASDPSGWWSSSQEQKVPGSAGVSRPSGSFIRTKMEPLVAPAVISKAEITARLDGKEIRAALPSGDVDFDLDSLSPSEQSAELSLGQLVEPLHASLDDDLASLRSVLSTSPNRTPSEFAQPLPLLDNSLAFELGAQDMPTVSEKPQTRGASTQISQDNLIDFDISVAPELNIDLNFAYIEKSSHPPLGPSERKVPRGDAS